MRHVEPNHPHPEKGQIKVYEDGESLPNIHSSKQGVLTDATFFQLCDLLGDPTYPEPSGDDKVQKEWVIEFTPHDSDEPYVFRIYDWKTYSEWETRNSLKEWSIGGSKESEFQATELVSLLKTLISMNKI